MRKINLTGREMSLMRAIGLGIGATGQELLEVTGYDPETLLDMLNGMMNAGYVNTTPYLLELKLEELPATHFETNPAYIHQIKQAMLRKY